jgi:hypothetical protein
MHLDPRRPAGIIVLASGIALASAMAVGAAVSQPAAPGVCNRSIAGSGSVSFTLNSGRAVWQRVPRLGTAPELESAAGPVTVVVFDGAHVAVPVLPALQQGDRTEKPYVYENVVCVLLPSGEELYYYNVDKTGLDLSGLSLERLER